MANILLGVTGGIAAYKAIELTSLLSKAGHHVKVILTESALRFVSALPFEAISNDTVHTSLWDDTDAISHITLADWAELMIVAPATANSMAKAAHGLADDLLSATLLAHTRPVLWVPAMNVHMYENLITRRNLEILKEKGDHVLLPDTGLLACGYSGLGKYPPNVEVLAAIETYLFYNQDLRGKKVMVTAGGSVERIDAMRMISNFSSGKMGIAIARALYLRGAEVHLIHANLTVELPYYFTEAIYAPSVDEMYAAVHAKAKDMDWIIKCAAVSDFKPKDFSQAKLKKSEGLTLELVATPDILAALGKEKRTGQKLIGFAAETENIKENALGKLKNKHLDMIVANHLAHAGKDTNEISLFFANPKLPTQKFQGKKSELAQRIVDGILLL